MTSLITGGSGFVSANLVQKLSDAIILDIREPFISTKKFVSQDISEKFDLNENLDNVIHLAALSGLQACAEDPDQAYKTNVLGTKNVLELCRKKDAKIIFASSFAVYGFPNIYSLTKTAGEWLCQQYHEKYGIKYSILRFANVYGENYHAKPIWNVVHTFIQNIIDGNSKLLIHGTGEQTRDFVYVQDLVNKIIDETKSEKNGVFDVCTKIQNSINTFAKTIIKTGIRNGFPEPKIEYGSTPSFRKETIQLLDKYLATPLECKTSLQVGLENTFQYAIKNKSKK
jgi:UDP-glucose 4-epimerase